MKARIHRNPITLRAKSLMLALVFGASLGHAADPLEVARLPAAPAVKRSIGRVFFTPAERRRHGVALAVTRVAPGDASREHQRLTVNGVLSSGTQGRTVWVNGAAVASSARRPSAWSDRNGNIWLTDADQRTHLIKPGQSIDRNGAIEDLLPPGSVTRR